MLAPHPSLLKVDVQLHVGTLARLVALCVHVAPEQLIDVSKLVLNAANGEAAKGELVAGVVQRPRPCRGFGPAHRVTFDRVDARLAVDVVVADRRLGVGRLGVPAVGGLPQEIEEIECGAVDADFRSGD